MSGLVSPVSFCPLIVIVKVLSKPSVAGRDALSGLAVMHVVIQVGDDESDRGRHRVISRKVRKSQIGRGLDCRSVGYIRKADPGDMLARINALRGAAIRWVEINRRADIG